MNIVPKDWIGCCFNADINGAALPLVPKRRNEIRGAECAGAEGKEPKDALKKTPIIFSNVSVKKL